MGNTALSDAISWFLRRARVRARSTLYREKRVRPFPYGTKPENGVVRRVVRMAVAIVFQDLTAAKQNCTVDRHQIGHHRCRLVAYAKAPTSTNPLRLLRIAGEGLEPPTRGL